MPFTRKLSRPNLGTTTLSFLTALFMVLADNGRFWHSSAARLGMGSFRHWLLLLVLGLALTLLLNLFFTLLSFRPVFKPILILLLLTAGLVGYFTDTFGTIIDRSMLHNLMETDYTEAGELVTWPLLGHFLLFGAIPAALVAVTRIRYRSRGRQWLARLGIVFGSLGMLAAVGLIDYKEIVLFGRENRDLEAFLNPVYPIYSLQKELAQQVSLRSPKGLQVVAPDAQRTASGARSVLVLVLGETARAQEFALNGYQRATNPELSGRGVISFGDVLACGTSTAESLPCIFSSQGKDKYNRSRARQQENLLDILQRTGVKVLWRDNDSGSKGVAARIAYEDLADSRGTDLCLGGNCFDEVLLQNLDERLGEGTGDMLIVLHMKGSHGPSYYKRTPAAFKPFSPECAQDNIQDCSRESIVNAYDNTIVYTDHFLARLIGLLKTRHMPTAMLYISDHGESLGENGLYLHGLPYALAPDEQTHVPLIFWASDAFAREKSLDLSALESRRQLPYSHDNIFHSLLGLFGIRTRIYRPDLDIFASCRHAAPQVASRQTSAGAWNRPEGVIP